MITCYNSYELRVYRHRCFCRCALLFIFKLSLYFRFFVLVNVFCSKEKRPMGPYTEDNKKGLSTSEKLYEEIKFPIIFPHCTIDYSEQNRNIKVTFYSWTLVRNYTYRYYISKQKPMNLIRLADVQCRSEDIFIYCL